VEIFKDRSAISASRSVFSMGALNTLTVIVIVIVTQTKQCQVLQYRYKLNLYYVHCAQNS